MKRVHPRTCGGPGDCGRCDLYIEGRLVEPEPVFVVHAAYVLRSPCPRIVPGSVIEHSADTEQLTCPWCIDHATELLRKAS